MSLPKFLNAAAVATNLAVSDCYYTNDYRRFYTAIVNVNQTRVSIIVSRPNNMIIMIAMITIFISSHAQYFKALYIGLGCPSWV